MNEQRICVEQALTLDTRNGAQPGFARTGELADFIVVDRDVLSVPVDELKEVKVLQTFVGGKKVYERAAENRPKGPCEQPALAVGKR